MTRLPAFLLTVLIVLPSGSRIGTVAGAAGGAIFGVLAGTGVTTGVVVARARLQNHHLESANELAGWQAAGVPVGAVAGGIAGARGARVLGAVVGGSIFGGALGTAAGVLIARLISTEEADVWAGGTMGGAFGLLFGFVIAWMFTARRRRRSVGPANDTMSAGRAAPLGVLVLSLAAACGVEPVELRPGTAVPPQPEDVEAVVLLLGDAGAVVYENSPVLAAAAADADQWAARIARDSAVVVVMLGDIVYPDGMHEPGSPGYWEDSAYVASQIEVIRGAAAQQHDARMYFVAGNHDWGMREDRAGTKRLSNLDQFLQRARARGPQVSLLPPAGTGIPEVVDVGERLRLVLLDTAWWLLDMEAERAPHVFEAVGDAIAGADRRHVVLASHHPFASVGPHGGTFPIWKTLGIRRLLYKSGALLQDLHSRPYRELRAGLGAVFRAHGRPLAWAGGHEHSLHIIAHDSANAPRFSIVSGSASKLSGVGTRPGMMFRASAPGYVRLLVRENGAVDAEVVAAPERFLTCADDGVGDQGREQCMREGLQSFATIYSTRLAEPDGG